MYKKIAKYPFLIIRILYIVLHSTVNDNALFFFFLLKST